MDKMLNFNQFKERADFEFRGWVEPSESRSIGQTAICRLNEMRYATTKWSGGKINKMEKRQRHNQNDWGLKSGYFYECLVDHKKCYFGLRS